MAKPAIVTVKRFRYRDADEEWSNKYHFTGSAPGDDASWKALADGVIAAERPMFLTDVYFVQAYGYNDGDHPSVWGHDYETPGPPPTGNSPGYTGVYAPGDTAAWVRWPTDKRNSRGKVVYARKYFHGVHTQGATDPDRLDTAQLNAIQTFAIKCIDQSISPVFHLCLPDGTPAKFPDTGVYVTTRTLKRRGKRPPT